MAEQKEEHKDDLKKYLQSAHYQQKRAELQFEINKRKVNIDRSVFKKTPKERQKLKDVKKAWKYNQKMFANA